MAKKKKEVDEKKEKEILESKDKKETADDYIRNFNNDVSQIYNLRNDENLSPLVNGHTIPLRRQQESKDVYGIYRYNAERDVIALFNVAGLDNTRDAAKVTSVELPHIDLSYDSSDKHGLPAGLEEGTVYKNANDKNDNSEYKVVKNQGKYVINRYQDGQYKPIKIDSPTLLLYREKPFASQDGQNSVKEKSKSLNLSV